MQTVLRPFLAECEALYRARRRSGNHLIERQSGLRQTGAVRRKGKVVFHRPSCRHTSSAGGNAKSTVVGGLAVPEHRGTSRQQALRPGEASTGRGRVSCEESSVLQGSADATNVVCAFEAQTPVPVSMTAVYVVSLHRAETTV
jgi:hypothetical protein